MSELSQHGRLTKELPDVGDECCSLNVQLPAIVPFCQPALVLHVEKRSWGHSHTPTSLL